VNTGSLRRPWSARVYTMIGTLILALIVPAGAASMDVTIEPAMTEGPADAPVTIVEFSDYQ
jgi:hypothetical protein